MSSSATSSAFPTVYEYKENGQILNQITPSGVKRRTRERQLLDEAIAQMYHERLTKNQIEELRWVFNRPDKLTTVSDVRKDEDLRYCAVMYLVDLQLRKHRDDNPEHTLFKTVAESELSEDVIARFEDERNFENPQRRQPDHVPSTSSGRATAKRPQRHALSSGDDEDDDDVDTSNFSGSTLHGTPQSRSSKAQTTITSRTSSNLKLKTSSKHQTKRAKLTHGSHLRTTKSKTPVSSHPSSNPAHANVSSGNDTEFSEEIRLASKRGKGKSTREPPSKNVPLSNSAYANVSSDNDTEFSEEIRSASKRGKGKSTREPPSENLQRKSTQGSQSSASDTATSDFTSANTRPTPKPHLKAGPTPGAYSNPNSSFFKGYGAPRSYNDPAQIAQPSNAAATQVAQSHHTSTSVSNTTATNNPTANPANRPRRLSKAPDRYQPDLSEQRWQREHKVAEGEEEAHNMSVDYAFGSLSPEAEDKSNQQGDENKEEYEDDGAADQDGGDPSDSSSDSEEEDLTGTEGINKDVVNLGSSDKYRGPKAGYPH